MPVQNNLYIVPPGEFLTLNLIMLAEKRLGSGTTLSNDDDIAEYFRIMMNLGWVYPNVSCGALKSLYDNMFSTLRSIENQAAIEMVAQFYDFCERSDLQPLPSWAKFGPRDDRWPWHSYWRLYTVGFVYTSSDNDRDPDIKWQRFEPSVMSPNHPEWRKDLEDLLKTWRLNPPADFINQGTTYGDKNVPANAAKAKLAAWATKHNMPRKAIEKMEVRLKEIILDMMKPASLTQEEYLFLFYLIISLANSNAADRQLAEKIVRTPTSSLEYPNDIFINHLVYILLMALSDPKGIYKKDGKGRQEMLIEIKGNIVRNDGAAFAIRQSIDLSLDILNADASYPIHDGEFPNIPFSTRKADTLEALDTARINFKK